MFFEQLHWRKNNTTRQEPLIIYLHDQGDICPFAVLLINRGRLLSEFVANHSTSTHLHRTYRIAKNRYDRVLTINNATTKSNTFLSDINSWWEKWGKSTSKKLRRTRPSAPQRWFAISTHHPSLLSYTNICDMRGRQDWGAFGSDHRKWT